MKLKKTKSQELLEDVLIESAAAEGMALAKVDGMVVFIPHVVPGDVVDMNIIKKKKNYAEARVITVKKPSPYRVEAVCPHFGSCGGCKWQTLKYEEQLRYKEQQVVDNLQRIGGVDTSMVMPICGSDKIYEYRNKLEFAFSNKRWRSFEEMESGVDCSTGAVGFHVPSLFDKVIDITHCALQASLSDSIRNSVREYALDKGLTFYDQRQHVGFLRNIVVRSSSLGEWMVIVIVAEKDNSKLYPLLDFIHDTFPQITSLQYIVNEKLNDTYSDLEVMLYKGKPYIEEEMTSADGSSKLNFRITPKSFYQTNSSQAEKLYGVVSQFAELRGDEYVYDLYTGTGTIALFLASQCKKVLGIEYVVEAVEDAKLNAQNNNFSNVEFYAGDMAKILTTEFVAEHGKPDVVITDPPRAGMHDKVITQLLQMLPSKIVYVSCNPATQARDIAMLMSHYSVGRIQPVDMFPHTQHVENVVELLKK